MAGATVPLRALLACLLLLSIACSSTRTTNLTMDPMKFKVIRHDGKRTVVHLDPVKLFKKAGLAYDQEKFKLAVIYYRLLIKEFPKGRYLKPANYNAALSLEALKRYSEAADHYMQVYSLDPTHRDARDSLMRIAFCRFKLKQWKLVVQAVDKLALGKLSLLDRIEALTRRGHACLKLEKYDLATRNYRKVLRIYNDPRYKQVLVGDAWVSRAQFEMGEIYRAQFDKIKFRLPLSTMRSAMKQKVALFLRAQRQYLRAIYLHNQYWAVVAGFRAANLYEAFYRHAMKAEIPKTLTSEEMTIYFNELRRHIMPLLRKAITIYQKNIAMSLRLGEKNEWTRKSQHQVARLRGILTRYEKSLKSKKPAPTPKVDARTRLKSPAPIRRRKHPAQQGSPQ